MVRLVKGRTSTNMPSGGAVYSNGSLPMFSSRDSANGPSGDISIRMWWSAWSRHHTLIPNVGCEPQLTPGLPERIEATDRVRILPPLG